MKYIGAHVSISGGVANAPLNAKELKATAFAMFTKNQRRWLAKPYETKEIDAFKKNCEKCGYSPEQILPHDGYLINLGHPDNEKLKQSRDAFLDEMQRCRQLGLIYLNFHPGSHLKEISKTECIKRIAESVNMALDQTESVAAVVENTAGQGSNIGYSFEQLAEIIDQVEDKSRVGVCFDTCHAFASGYDLRTSRDCDQTFRKFGKTVGFKYLKGMHLNDAKSQYASHVDRHHNLNHGNIGLECFRYIVKDKRFDKIPLILETIDESLWEREIKLLKSYEQ